MQIFDAHTHFFSYTWLEHFFKLGRDKFAPDDTVEALAAKLGWEMPPANPKLLGERWLAEQEKHGLSRQVLFASKPNDAEYLAVAVNAFSDRLTGFVMVDPTAENAREVTHYSLNILPMRGVLLFPAMHHFHAHDDRAVRVYDEALFAEAVVFVHFGHLSIPIFQKLGIPDNIDLKFSNPRDLLPVAREFRDLNFIIPHLGCGRFEEALEVAAECPNVYFDTASSNSWIEAPLTLTNVFERTLHQLGPERILFGTDSSFFPRGWRKDIFETQLAALKNLNTSTHDLELIFGGNLTRILK